MLEHISKYAVVGLIGTSTHFSLLYFFVEALYWDPVLASVSAFPPVVFLSYILNRNWTFKSDKEHQIALPKYLAVSLVSLANNSILMYTLVSLLDIWYLTAQLCSIAIIPVINFVLKKYWAFA